MSLTLSGYLSQRWLAWGSESFMIDPRKLRTESRNALAKQWLVTEKYKQDVTCSI